MDEQVRRFLQPQTEKDVAALRCLLRLRGEGATLEEIAARLQAETGVALPPAAIDVVLRRVAGPAPRAEGGDPNYISGYLGGG